MEKENIPKVSFLRKIFIFFLVLIISIILYSYFIGTKGLVVKEYSIKNSKLPDSFQGLKIVHFSDLHFGSTVRTPELKKIINQINLLKPEIIFFTGDLIDKDAKVSKDDLVELIALLNSLDAVNTYMVKGNHDFINSYEEILKNLNIKLLQNQSELFYYNDNTPIMIIGLDDYLNGKEDITKAFENYSEEYYTILLTHEPDVVLKLNDYEPDIILAGHSHNGQVRLPFIGSIVKVKGAEHYYDEKYYIDDIPLFISGGLGTSKYPFRLFNHPSINFYRFYNK
ncbi:MAG: metallophosphoesterase [Mollicutes bacterium]|nr:metallophosphoesterase [Mollicutes bacterium]